MDFQTYLNEHHKNVEGWCSPTKAQKLYNYIIERKPELCLEIGVFGGSSLIPQALALSENNNGLIVGIDPWSNDVAIEGMENDNNKEWWHKVDMAYILNSLNQFIEKFKLQSYVDLIKDKAENIYDNFKDNSIDIIHIDGNHSEESAFKDAFYYLPKVKDNGIIFFDDIHWSEKPGQISTKKAHDFLLKHCEKIEQEEDWVVLKKLANKKVS